MTTAPHSAPSSPLLGVNIDHIATLREVRKAAYPSPLQGARAAIAGGADFITMHIREDRRHVQEADLAECTRALSVPINLELAVDNAMVGLARRYRPAKCCLVPERRQELTTEGGLNLLDSATFEATTQVVAELTALGIEVSLFIDPDPAVIDKAVATGAPVVELHTGTYANAYADLTTDAQNAQSATSELETLSALNAEHARLAKAVEYAKAKGLRVHAGHGLTLANLPALLRIDGIAEWNIGHALVSDAILVGMEAATRAFKNCIQTTPSHQ